MAALAAIFAFHVRTRTQILARELELLRQTLAVESAENFAFLKIVEASSEAVTDNGWFYSHYCVIAPGTSARIRVRDEAGKVDINSADDRLMLAALRISTTSRAIAETLLDEIIDFRDSDDDQRPRGAERAAHVGRQLKYGPKNAPFESLDELLQLPSMNTEMFNSLRPLLTIESRHPGLDPNHASVDLLRSLAVITGAAAGLSASPEQMNRNALAALMPPELRVLTLKANFEVETTLVTSNGIAKAYSSLFGRTTMGNEILALRSRTRIFGFQPFAAANISMSKASC